MELPSKERRTVSTIDKKTIWLYGSPFSGKTYLANQFPDPIMLNTDGNIKFIDAPYIAIKDNVTMEGRITKRQLAWDVFTDTVFELEKKQNDFKTIVVDLLEDLHEHCRLYIYDRENIEHESDNSFKYYDVVKTEYLKTIRRLVNLDYENIILISHEDSTKDLTKKSGDKITRIAPNINEKIANKVAGMVDVVCRVIAEDDKRTLSFKTSEVIFGGGRLNVRSNEIPCEFDELMKVYDEANMNKKRVSKVKESIKVETATNEPDNIETSEIKTRTSKSPEITTEAKNEEPVRRRRTRNE